MTLELAVGDELQQSARPLTAPELPMRLGIDFGTSNSAAAIVHEETAADPFR